MVDRGLRWNVIVATMGVTTAVVVAMLVFGAPFVERRVLRHVADALAGGLARAAERLDAGEDPDAVADALGVELGAHVTVVGPGGAVVGDSGAEPPAFHGATADASFVARVRSAGEVRADSSAGTIEVGLRLDDRTVVVGRTGADVAGAIARSIRDLLGFVGALALLLGVAMTWVFSRTLVAPVRELTEVANALARGDLHARTRSERPDELGDIGRAIDGMADELDARHRSLRAEEARLRVVLDSMGEAVFVTDRRGVIAVTNAALDRIVGPGAAGRTVPEVIRHPELNQAVSAARNGATTGVEFETVVQSERRALDALVAPLPMGAGVVGVLHDVTKLKHTDRVRRDFVANASHELRTPLTAIRGYAETARSALDADPEAAKRFLDVILRHALRLQSLVDDLVSLSRAESPEQRFELGTLDAAAVVVEVARGLEGQAREKGQTLVLDVPDAPALAETNERALDQILVNLVDNAIKYTPRGGTIRVGVAATPDHVSIDVRDTGPGIPPEHHERIFERFYRVDPGRSRDLGGTGLGLSIVKHLAARIGAQVKVESPPDEGACFRVVLRGARAPA